MTLGELGSNILDIHEYCQELGMSDEEIQNLPIIDNIQYLFGKQVKMEKDFTLRVEETQHGFVLLKEIR